MIDINYIKSYPFEKQYNIAVNNLNQVDINQEIDLKKELDEISSMNNHTYYLKDNVVVPSLAKESDKLMQLLYSYTNSKQNDNFFTKSLQKISYIKNYFHSKRFSYKKKIKNKKSFTLNLKKIFVEFRNFFKIKRFIRPNFLLSKTRFVILIALSILLLTYFFNKSNSNITFKISFSENNKFNKNKEDQEDTKNTNKIENENENKGSNIFNDFSQMMIDDKITFTLQKGIKTKLSEVKGINEIVDEIDLLIKMIKNPDKYREAGAKIPKGILLEGKPGTGKTLIAKAIAGTSEVNFISVCGSDFESMYVGIGNTRIKKLFEMARKNSPCIIFIDEIDSLLTSTKRSSNEHSSSRSMVNTFLTEMDGFNKLENVFVIGATNHIKSLDIAAIRPGRFDKKIHVNLPDSKGRSDIAEFYLNRLKIQKQNDVTSNIISQISGGFTGAEIENLINLAGQITINKSTNLKNLVLDLDTVTEARDRILMGISRKYSKDMAKRRFMTSIHEMGHTLVCYLNPICKESLLKVAIIPSGRALGVTQRMEIDDTVYTKEYFLSSIDCAMGGHVAEEIIFGKNNVTAGCSSDLNTATSLARQMVNELGMYGNEVGYLYVDIGKDIKEEKLGDKQKELINKKVNEILDDSYLRVKQILTNDSDKLIKLSRQLFKYNTLDAKEVDGIYKNTLTYINRPEVREDYDENNPELRS